MKPINYGWIHVGQHKSHRMEGLKGFLQVVTPGAWLLTWDLAEAYFHLMLQSVTSRDVEILRSRSATRSLREVSSLHFRMGAVNILST
jgi:hypothetical protein